MPDLTSRIAEAQRNHAPMIVSYEGRTVCTCSRLGFGPEAYEVPHTPEHAAAEIAKVVYPRIETEEQLQDVYPQSVILDADGDVYAMDEYRHAVLLTGWRGMPYEPPALPAIVLWSPEVTE